MAYRSFAANKGRNIFLILAIFMTTFMLGTIISLSVSYMETLTAHSIRMLGTTAHVNLSNVTGEQIEKIKSLDYVSVCSVSIITGDVQDGGYLNGNKVMLEWCELTEWDIFRKPIISNIVGNYPQNYDEIMIPSWILESMGIDDPRLGMEITLDYQIDGEQKTQVFKLAGYFTSYALSRFNGSESIYVSQVFAEDTGGIAAVHIQYIKNNAEYTERIIQDANIDLWVTKINIYLISEKLYFEPLNIIYAVIGVCLVIVGFLLIYNVMSVSVSRDIRFYGLLKTTGMTPSQIRNMVLQQILLLCAVGIPAGLIFSALVSLVVVPFFLNASGVFGQTDAIISFNPLIYIGAALFALFTALFGAFSPAKKAAAISPIEATRFSEQGYTLEISRSSPFNPMKVAWRNVFRVQGRAVLVFGGMFIGMTLFLLVGVILGGADMDLYAQNAMPNIDGDIYLINRMPDLAIGNDSDNLQAFTPEFMERLNSLPGLIDMDIRYARKIQVYSGDGYLDMDGNPHYRTDFVYESDESEDSVIYDINLYIEKDGQKQALGIIKEWVNKYQYIQWRSRIASREEVEQQVTALMIIGNSISVILWFIGVLSFINVITTSIISRRHEIALLESIGQSPKQSRQMLMSEGIIYAVITLFLVCVVGGALIYILFSLLASQYDYIVFSFPYIPLLIMVCVMFSVCFSVPRLMYRFVNKMTIVERLREIE